MCDNENACCLRTDSTHVYPCFTHSVFSKAVLLKVFSKSCPHGLAYAVGGEYLVLLLQEAFYFYFFYSFSSPLILKGICLEVGLGISFPFLRPQPTAPNSRTGFVRHD